MITVLLESCFDYLRFSSLKKRDIIDKLSLTLHLLIFSFKFNIFVYIANVNLYFKKINYEFKNKS